MKKYSFIGVGNMASAIIKSLIGKGGIRPELITLYDKFPAQYDRLESESGVEFPHADSAADAAAAADYVFLSVKPQVCSEVLGELSAAVSEGKIARDKVTFVSIMAGIPTERIRAELGYDAKVIRTMPNTPLMIGKGVTALCRSEGVSDKTFGDICRTFSLSGEVVSLPEDKLNAIISVTSSSPAYMFKFIESIAAAAKAQGIDAGGDAALFSLICRVMIGSASMVLETGKSPEELRRMVTSPGGTTAEAIRVFEEHDFDGTVAEAMQACTDRAEELSRR